VLRRATHAEILLAVVQPRQWITDTVELGELKFVCCGQEVTARVILLISNDVAARCTPRVLVLALDLLEGEVECHLLLTLFSHGHLEHVQGIRYRMHGAHNILYGLQMPNNVSHGDGISLGSLTGASSRSVTHGGARNMLSDYQVVTGKGLNRIRNHMSKIVFEMGNGP
jgi:hypothetical protein